MIIVLVNVETFWKDKEVFLQRIVTWRCFAMRVKKDEHVAGSNFCSGKPSSDESGLFGQNVEEDFLVGQAMLQVEGKDLGDLGAVAAVVDQDDFVQHFLRSVLDQAPDGSEKIMKIMKKDLEREV